MGCEASHAPGAAVSSCQLSGSGSGLRGFGFWVQGLGVLLGLGLGV